MFSQSSVPSHKAIVFYQLSHLFNKKMEICSRFIEISMHQKHEKCSLLACYFNIKINKKIVIDNNIMLCVSKYFSIL